MKKASLLFILLGAILACIAMGYGLLQKAAPPAALPDRPTEDPVVATWSYNNQNVMQTIILTFKEDGQVNGTVLGDSFTGTWGKEKEIYYIYNSEGSEIFTAVFFTSKGEEELIATATASGCSYSMVKEHKKVAP